MLLLLLYGALALSCSFLCSIAEAVLLSIPPSHIAALEQGGTRSARLLRDFKANIDRPLAAILSLNTIAHTVGAAGVGAQAAVVFGSRAVGLTSAILTLLILVLSEIIPKTLGAVYWRALTPVVVPFVQVLIWVLYPLVLLSEQLTKFLTPPDAQKGMTRDEFAALATLGEQQGHLKAKESRILKNLLRLQSVTVQDIMTPRTVILRLPEDMTVSEVLTQHPQLPFSRLPIYRGTPDDITGFVLKTDILLSQAPAQDPQKETGQLHSLKRDIQAIPHTASLSDAFDTLLDQRAHLALVVDEYGGVAGLVTLEDLLETLLGFEIVDEADTTVDMQVLAREQWKKRAERAGFDLSLIEPISTPEEDEVVLPGEDHSSKEISSINTGGRQ